MGLLEVVADDLVQLHEVRVPVDPGGEALVEIRPGRLRQRVVGRVPDQQMAEAERVLARELRSVWPQELSAHERGQRTTQRKAYVSATPTIQPDSRPKPTSRRPSR